MFVYLIPVGLATAAVWSLLLPPYFQFECNNVTAVSFDRSLNFFVKKTLQEADSCPPPRQQETTHNNYNYNYRTTSGALKWKHCF